MRRVSMCFVALVLTASVASAAVRRDTTRPSQPAKLIVTSVSSTQVNLSWAASSDNIAVTGYALERCLGVSCTSFAQVSTTTGVTFPVVGLTANSHYRFRVRAGDAARNWSEYSNVVTALTAVASTCGDPSATNYGLAAPCTYPPPPPPQTCRDPGASNVGQPIPCVYPPTADSMCPGGTVALTYDDGPTPATAAVLDALKAQGLHATFFLLGQNVLLYPELARRIVDEGHAIGNHTWDHQDLTTLTDEQIDQEISNTQNIILQTTGVTPTFFRPPYGSVNAAAQARIRAAGLHTALWTEDTNDWAGATANDIFWTVTTMQNGGIVLMHDQMPETAAAIPDIAWYLKSYWAGNNICAGKLAPTTHVMPMDDWWGMFFFVHAVPWR